MTPEQWAAVKQGRWYYHDYGIGIQGQGLVGERRDEAAVLLCGQPFGFTWEDVRLLRKLIAAEENDNALVYDDERHLVRALMPSLASRIAALLPPEEPLDGP